MSSIRQQAEVSVRDGFCVIFRKIKFYVDLDAVVAEKNKSSYTMSTGKNRQSLYLPWDKSAGQKNDKNEMRQALKKPINNYF